jgi:hypothetical protein
VSVIEELPAVEIPGHRASGLGSDDHPMRIDRVLAPEGSVVWVNSSGDQTPIHLRSEEVAAVLPGEWRGVASRAGQGSWCVLRRA